MTSPDSPALAELRAKAITAVAIEALWDGDTEGWFVELRAVVNGEAGYESRFLQGFSRGGDIRIFNGAVPPWPEASEAAAIGLQLANLLGVPFHFPAIDHPEDGVPHWWETSQSYPCGRCGMCLLQPQSCRWRGVCYYCHLALEREAKEAEWSAEQRSAPRCSICLNPAVGETEQPPRCKTCRDNYRIGACLACGIRMTLPRQQPEGETCSSCAMANRFAALSAADRQRLREVALSGTVEGLIEAKELLQCGLSEAQYALDAISRSSDETG